MARDAQFHTESEVTKGGLKLGYNKVLGITILTWDKANRRGTFHWKNKKVYEFERLSQQEAASVQIDNFVYDNTVTSKVADYMRDFPHAVEAFRQMMRTEVLLARTHVFFYHSYGATALINDIGACIMRVVNPSTLADPDTRNAILPRTDRSAFNNRSPANIIKNFSSWYHIDGSYYFKAIGMSTVLNCIKPDTEATVAEYFKGNYQVGTDLNKPLDELLNRFQLKDLKDALLQMALEADFDVGPYFDSTKFFIRGAHGTPWAPVDIILHYDLSAAFAAFATDDNTLGPQVVSTPSGHKAMLSRPKQGAQARGTLVTSDNATHQLLMNTYNTGNYLQLAVPHDVVAKMAYANVLSPTYGTPDTLDPSRALDKITDRKVTVNGQARVIPRPDLMWGKDVKQTLFQFSRHAGASRESYLRLIEALIAKHVADNKLKLRSQRLLKPPSIIVRSHNTMWQAQESAKSKAGLPSNTPDLVKEHSTADYSFLCLQECVTDTIDKLRTALQTSKSTHALLTGKGCGAKTADSVMVYDAKRFQLVGSPVYTCFELTDGSMDAGRPAMIALFDDTYLLNRRIAVVSIHAPHGNSHPYSLNKNLKRFVDMALNGASKDTLHHIIMAGDFNRQDWDKTRSIWTLTPSYSLYHGTPPKPKLISAQKAKSLKPTISKLAYDNVLYSSRSFMHTLERKKFEVLKKHGSDHAVIEVVFRA